MRKVIVGDIHGCREEVLELLGSVRADWKKDMLIQMGDMVDRGPDPCGVLNVFREFKEEMGERCVLVRGNHEQILMECTRDPEQKDLWSLNGGSKTIRSCWEWGQKLDEWAAWLEEHTVLWYQDEEIFCAHAGARSGRGEENDPEILLWDREAILNNTYGDRLLIVGHTPLSVAAYMDGSGGPVEPLTDGMVRPLPARGMICIDTGCVFGGKLTAMVIEDGRFLLRSVKSKGRRA